MENPLKAIRVQLGLTQKEVAYETDMTQGAVVKYEQGLYEEPSANLVWFLVRNSGKLFEDIIHDYAEWRVWQRRQADLPSILTLSFPNGVHPLETYRDSIGKSKQGFCVLLCMHPATYNEYESGRLPTMPRAIKTALLQGGLGLSDVSVIESYGEAFYFEQQQALRS